MGSSQTTWLDVTVVSPVTKTAMAAGAANRPAVAVERAATHKHRVYQTLPNLVAFALEAGGRPCMEASHFLSRIAPRELEARSAWLSRTWALAQSTLQLQQAHLLDETLHQPPPSVWVVDILPAAQMPLHDRASGSTPGPRVLDVQGTTVSPLPYSDVLMADSCALNTSVVGVDDVNMMDCL
jgi:hypothetical protein